MGKESSVTGWYEATANAPELNTWTAFTEPPPGLDMLSENYLQHESLDAEMDNEVRGYGQCDKITRKLMRKIVQKRIWAEYERLEKIQALIDSGNFQADQESS